MEQAETTIAKGQRAYERYGWMILAASAVLGIVSALMTTLPPISWFWDPLFTSGYSIMGAWGLSWISFDLLALTVILVPFRRGERWAWYALWLLPLLLLAQFVLAPDLILNAVLAAIAAAGLVLPFRRFFPGAEKESPRVK